MKQSQDVLLYRTPLLRNLTSGRQPLLLLNPSLIRAALHLSPTAFTDFALLLGTDFTRRMPNIGPARALKFISAHGSIERVLECEKQFRPRGDVETYLQEVRVGREVFGTMPPVGDVLGMLHGVRKDEGKVGELMEHFGLRRALNEVDWGGEGNRLGDEASLAGNYYGDDPRDAML